MNKYQVEYLEDNGAPSKTITVEALDYTKAYLEASFILSITAIIISLILI